MKDDINFVNDELYRLVGENQKYYLKKWEKKNGGWNWAAAIFSFWWLGYRKMYKHVFILLGLSILFDVILWLTHPHYPNPFSNIFGLIIFVTYGYYGNRFYKNDLKEKLLVIEREKVSSAHKEDLIRQKGGTSILGILYVLVLLVVYVGINLYFIYDKLN